MRNGFADLTIGEGFVGTESAASILLVNSPDAVADLCGRAVLQEQWRAWDSQTNVSSCRTTGGLVVRDGGRNFCLDHSGNLLGFRV